MMETTIARSEIIRKLDNISELIGNTPLIRLENIQTDREVKLYAKAEWLQLGGNTKARAAFNIIRQAILSGELDEKRYLLDSCSGNMAIAYATIAAKLNIRVKLCVPNVTSKEKLKTLRALGAEIQLTSIDNLFESERNVATKIYSENPDRYFYANQYLNNNYWKSHYYTTAEEIIEQTNGEVSHFVSGIGATGTFTGVGKRLKVHNRRIQVIELYTENSDSQNDDWEKSEIIKNSSFHDSQLADYEMPISYSEAKDFSKEIARQEGLVLSPSSAANILGALKIAQDISLGTVVTVLPNY